MLPAGLLSYPAQDLQGNVMHPVSGLGPPAATNVKTDMLIVQSGLGSSSQITLSFVKDNVLTPPLKDWSLEITPLEVIDLF